MTKAIYESLSEEDQNTVTDLVNLVIDGVTTEDAVTHESTINLNLLMATLEKLNAEKKSAKEAYEKVEKEQKEEQKKAASLKGAELVKEIDVDAGDMIVFTMGTGLNKKEYTRKAIKKTDKSVTIDLGADAPAEGKTSKRYIKFASISAVVKADGTVKATLAA